MKLKQLESLLGELDQFSEPKAELEQYPTGPHIASRMIYAAETTFGDINGKIVADFGCGCGTLGIASALLGAEHVVGIDVDSSSLEIALQNAEELEVDIDLLLCDVRHFQSARCIDTVVMNPPFGTKRKGIDMAFLSMALQVASRAVYSLHKTSTREHVKKTALRSFNCQSAEVLCELRFDIPQMYKFHRQKEVDVAVDLWRFLPRTVSPP
ncbi:S-adenosyl-L-methionine-dependent methyltransferases superfamily protein isoform X2 [Wolffia australiana]